MSDVHHDLQSIRDLIDSVDAELIQLLKHRSLLVEHVTAIKKISKQAPLQPERFAKMKVRLHELAEQQGLDKQLVDEVWEAIHESSIRQQAKELEK